MRPVVENPRTSQWPLAALALVATLCTMPPALAGDRLAWTGAITEVEGAAGGGLVPWALIGGLGTSDQLGASAAAAYLKTSDFSLRTTGLALGLYDHAELSYARQRFNAGSVIPGLTLGQDILGLKMRLAGDAVFQPDRWWPQIALGAQYKKTLDYDLIPRAVGATRGQDVEFYVAATKLYFATVAGRNLLLNLTVRRTRANQMGLLGFGGDRHAGYSVTPEFSAGILVAEDWLVGGEYRLKPDNLSAFSEDRALDGFVAWNPTKIFTLTMAYVDLGRIAGKPDQRGLYVSIWLGI